LPTANAVATVGSSVRSPRTTSTSGGHLRDRQGRRVRHEHALGLDHGLDLGEDLLLDAELLEDGLDDQVGLRERLLGRRAGHEGLEPVRRVLREAPLRAQGVDLAVHVRDALVDPVLVEVGEDDGHLQPADEEQRQLTRHEPRADDTDARDRPGQRPIRCPGRLLRPPVDEIEGVERGAELVAHREVGERLRLGLERGVAVGGAGEADQLERPVRRGRGAVDLRVGDLLPDRERALPELLVAVDRRPLHGAAAGEDVARPHERLGQEVGRLEDRVEGAELEGLGAVQHGVVVERVTDDHLDGLLRPDEVR
jgi:hypothetical protein